MPTKTNDGLPEYRAAELNEIKHLLEELEDSVSALLSKVRYALIDDIDDDEPIGTRKPTDYRTLDFESLKEKWEKACRNTPSDRNRQEEGQLGLLY